MPPPLPALQDAGAVWDKLQQLKHVVIEPRSGGDRFDDVIRSYYDAVKEGRGGLFFAVFRCGARLSACPLCLGILCCHITSACSSGTH